MTRRPSGHDPHGPARSSRGMRYALVTCLVLGVAASVMVFTLARGAERDRIRQDLALHTQDRAAAIDRQFRAELDVLNSTLRFFHSSERVERDEFRRFTEPMLQMAVRHEKVFWVPRVTAEQRAAYEAETASEVPGFAVLARDDGGTPLPAGRRDQYHPIHYSSPDAPDQWPLGLDLGAVPPCARVLQDSCDTARAAVSRPIAVHSEDGTEWALFAATPVFNKEALSNSVEQKRRNLKGHVACVLHIWRTVDAALASIQPRGIDVAIYDPGAPEPRRPLYCHKSRTRQRHSECVHDGSALLASEVAIDVGGQPVLVVCEAVDAFVAARSTWYPWLWLGCGLALTGLLAAYLWRMNVRAAARERLSIQLREMNRNLRSEVERRRHAQNELALSAKVFEQSSEAIVITDADNKIVSVNRAFTEMTGYAAEEVIGQSPRVLKSERHGPEFYEAMWRDIAASGAWQGEIWNRRKDGEVVPEWLVINAVTDESGRVMNYIAVASDLTRRKAAAERINFLAYYDALTRLPNRALLQDRLRQVIANARRGGHEAAVLFADLDRFKYINDSLGHVAGDTLLQEVAKRLQGLLRESDIVSRTGGDEFVIVLQQVAGMEDAANVARKVYHAVARPFTIDGHELSITMSIGVSLYPRDGTSIAALMKCADIAMYRSKESGQEYCFYTPEMNEAATERLRIEMDLRRALECGELSMHYQPQVDARSGHIVGAEALVRWHHPELGYVSPGQFIPVAEECGLIRRIGEWGLAEVCSQNLAWQARGLPAIPVAVNISAAHFSSPHFRETVVDVLEATGLQPGFLELEITESALMHNPTATAESLKAMREIGVQLSVDDFGTGYSSLSYLKHFPIDKLKIDQAFVAGIPDDADDTAITLAVIQMARSLKLKVIAEGVETAEQLAFLREHACDQIQGYYFSRPLPPEEFAALLERERLVEVG